MSSKVVIAVEGTIVSKGIAGALTSKGDFEVVGVADNGSTALDMFQSLEPEILILGLRLPDMCAAEDLISFLEINRDAKIMIYADKPGDVETNKSLSDGALGFLSPEMNDVEILEAVKRVAKGKPFVSPAIKKILDNAYIYEELTPSETDVIRKLVGGLSNKEIAFALDVSENTIKTHIKHIFEKLHVSDRTTAAVVAIKRGIARVDI